MCGHCEQKMIKQIVLYLSVFIILQRYSVRAQKSSLWVFGTTDPPSDSIPIKPISGHINMYQKLVRIPLTVHPCRQLVQVRVVVNNTLSTPEVRFSRQTNTVTIVYRPLQTSVSTFEVTGDAEPVPYCTDHYYDQPDINGYFPD